MPCSADHHSSLRDQRVVHLIRRNDQRRFVIVERLDSYFPPLLCTRTISSHQINAIVVGQFCLDRGDTSENGKLEYTLHHHR